MERHDKVPLRTVGYLYSCFLNMRKGWRGCVSQNWQCARPLLQSSELGQPHPLTCRRVCPPPLVPGTDTVVLKIYYVLCGVYDDQQKYLCEPVGHKSFFKSFLLFLRMVSSSTMTSQGRGGSSARKWWRMASVLLQWPWPRNRCVHTVHIYEITIPQERSLIIKGRNTVFVNHG